MIFITGADHRFKEIVKVWINKLSKFSYQYLVYDLGCLGMNAVQGFEEADINFKTKGYYNSISGNWKSTGLWKPKVILDALNRFIFENIVYLDADAFVETPLAINWDFDIGVVKREVTPENVHLYPMKVFLRGDYNAGVIFFANTPQIRQFVVEWAKLTKEIGNDQAALSVLLRKSNLIIRVFPEEYNTNFNTSRAIIYHKTGGKKNGKTIRQSYG